MKQRAYYYSFKFSFRHCIVFLVTVCIVLFGGKVSAANLPQIQWLGLINYGIQQQISIDSISTPRMLANHKAIYSQDLEIDLRQDGIVVWRKIAPMDLVTPLHRL